MKSVGQSIISKTLVAFLMVINLAAFPKTSWSHAFPDHAEPRVGATLNVAPTRVRIWFDSALEPAFSTITIRNSKNEEVDKRDGHVNPSDPTLLEVNVPPLPDGAYRVLWNVVARDGHRTEGDYTFAIKVR